MAILPHRTHLSWNRAHWRSRQGLKKVCGKIKINQSLCEKSNRIPENNGPTLLENSFINLPGSELNTFCGGMGHFFPMNKLVQEIEYTKPSQRLGVTK